ncbi:alpha/beta hydrolase [uncultured Sphingomonas sp.]|uniref:alpha/beta hydrolase n=1 Tax=uncultured Sphingomonas sp. TaxID=158754 RepID=UPI0035CA9C9B
MSGWAAKLGRGRWAGAVLGIMAAACSPLRTFDAVVPKDGGVSLVTRDAAFGLDPRQRLDVYAPTDGPNDGRAVHPVIVFFYGGSWNSGTKAGYSFVGRALAARGFVVAVPDYRLVPQVRFPAFLEDNAAAVRWVRRHVARLGGDPDRLVLAGHSAGAYDAAMLALDPRWLGADRAAVRGWVGLAGPYDFLPLDQPVTQAAFGAAADPRQTQPIAYAGAGDPPTFLATGDDDTLVLPRNSDALAARLTAAGVPVERRRYAGIGHVGLVTAIARPFRRRAPVLDDVVAFARRVTAER